jgi:hypothetical protein
VGHFAYWPTTPQRVVSGGIATLLSVVGVALWVPEVISYRTLAPDSIEGAGRGA